MSMSLLKNGFLFILCFLVTASCYAQEEQQQCLEPCAPKINICGWKMCAFDINADALLFQRKRVSKQIDFSSHGIGGDIILSSKDLNLGWNWGWRVTGEIFFDNCDRVSVSYLSSGEWSDTAKKKREDNEIYSVLSAFGTVPFQGYLGTDQASFHSIHYASKFHSWEFNYYSHLSLFEIPQVCCLDGSFIYGYRLFNLEEEFTHKTESVLNNASMNYHVKTCNSMQGPQGGVEMWIPMTRCLDIGLEVKGSLFFNDAEQRTRIIADADLALPLNEKKDGWNASYGVEGSAKFCFEVFPGMYVRGGYQYLYLEDVALAIENFNKNSPFDVDGRSKKLKSKGHVSYQGTFIGLDLCW